VVSVTHQPRPDWRAWFNQRMMYGSSAAPLARRHPGALAPVRLSAWSIATWVLAVGVHPLLGTTISAGSAAALTRKLRDVPDRVAFRLAWRGNLHAGDQIATAVRRAWWPLLGLTAVASKRARVALLMSAIASRHPIRVVDDVAYSVGVWRGVVSERTLGPLLPDVSSWPGRQNPSPSPPRAT